MLIALALGVLGSTACASSSRQAASPVVVADQRLSGTWRLRRFAPEVALDLPLQAVLASELGNLTVTFGSGQFTATGPGVNLSGRYSVLSAQGDAIEVVVYDPDGVARHFTAQFVGTVLTFHAEDKPWQGDGALQRA